MSDAIKHEDSIDPVVSQFRQFFANHPELPPLQEVWTVIVDFIFHKQLTTSLSNIEFAYKVCRKEIDEAINKIPSQVWKEKVVIPEFKQRQASQPKRESAKPFGVATVQWIHNR